jgi:hypothetical protein
VFSTTTGNGGDDVINFANRTEQYIRLHVTQWNNQHGRLNEFEVCGSSTAAPSLSKDSPQETALTANMPEQFQLHQNYPNPFNPSTQIAFSVKEVGEVQLSVYNINGQVVRTLVSGQMNPGHHTITWNGRDNAGNVVPSGLYFYKLRANGYEQTRKMTMTK